MNDAQKLRALTEQVAIAAQAFEDSCHAAAAGIDPTQVWQAAARVVDSATARLNTMIMATEVRAMSNQLPRLHTEVRNRIASQKAAS